jgi:hypothetical protein
MGRESLLRILREDGPAFGRSPARRRRKGRLFAAALPALRAVLALGLVLSVAQRTPGASCDYAVLGDAWVSVGDDVTITDGLAGGNGWVSAGMRFTAASGVSGGGSFSESGDGDIGDILFNGDTYLGSNTRVGGSLDSGGDVYIDAGGVHVTGDVTAAGEVHDSGATVDGTTTAYGSPSTFPGVAMPHAPSFTAGGDDVTDGGDLAPGSYGDVFVPEDGTLGLRRGNYFFETLDMDSGATLDADLSGGVVGIYVLGPISIGDDLLMSLANGTADHVYTQTNEGFAMGSGGNWSGTIYAPYDVVSIGSGCSVTGALYGQGVSVLNDCTITGMPVDFAGTVIPLPPACLLGVLGLGLAGLLGRRGLGRRRSRSG